MIKIIAGTLTQFFEKIELETLILLGFFCGFNMPKRNLNWFISRLSHSVQ